MKHTQQGVSLIEILIALLVLSIGLIGVASLQLNALQANQSSFHRSQAVNLTYDIMDRLRANHAVATGGNNYVTNGFTAIGNCNMNFQNVANNSVAVNDINGWTNALRCNLPQGHGSIIRGPNNLYTITVQWSNVHFGDDGDGDGDGDGQPQPQWESFTTRTQL